MTKGRGRRAERECEWCGDTFHPLLAEVRRGRGRMCSRLCANRAKADAMRVPGWRAKYEKRRAEDPTVREQRAAHAKVDWAVRSGQIEREPCEVCGCEKVDAHHDDYSRPLDVRWLCRTHHKSEHAA